MVFGKDYADAYDHLYRDKDYNLECNFIEEVFRRYDCRPRTILDLGCGTGGHSIILAEKGFDVTGVDRSADMLNIARRKARESGAEVEFIEGDLRNIVIGRKFDAVISMFAVMGYQISNADVAAFCKQAGDVLVPGGIFLFDCWHGPAVLHERPGPRTKEVETEDGRKITRITESELDITEHIVRVHFRMQEISKGGLIETTETHSMRYFFPKELENYMERAGFKRTDFYPFPDLNGKLSERDWNMTVVGVS